MISPIFLRIAISPILSFAVGQRFTAALDIPAFDPVLFSVVPVALLLPTLVAAGFRHGAPLESIRSRRCGRTSGVSR